MQRQCRHYVNERSPAGINTNKEKETFYIGNCAEAKSKGGNVSPSDVAY